MPSKLGPIDAEDDRDRPCISLSMLDSEVGVEREQYKGVCILYAISWF